jgi:hypothetical protein
MLVFLDGGQTVLELTILQGEVTAVTMVLQGADPVTDALVPYDVTAATSLTFTASTRGGTPIMNAKTLTKVTPAAGVVSFTPLAIETAVAGKYEALAVATFPGSPPVIRKFPGRLIIKDAIA